jgi:hypothetical protein
MGSWSYRGSPPLRTTDALLSSMLMISAMGCSKVSSHHEPHIRESHEQKDANVKFPLLFLNETIPPIVVSYQFPTIPAEEAGRISCIL